MIEDLAAEEDLTADAVGAEHPAAVDTTDSPIFLGGLSHSGKTPLRRLLGLHPDLSMTRRSALWLRDDRQRDDLGDPAALERCLSALAREPRLRDLAPDPDALRAEFLTGPRTATRLYGLIHAQHARRTGRPRWGDQLGMVELVAAELLAAFPDARFVHLVRDPRDRLGALQRRSLRPGAVGWQTGRWIETVDLGLAQAARWPDRYRIVRYEEFVADPVGALTAVCAFCGLTPTPEMLAAAGALVLEPSRPVPGVHRRFVERATARRLTTLGYTDLEPAATGTDRGGRRSNAQRRVRTGVEALAMVTWRLIGRRVTAVRKET